ncbi:MAG: hypothetical protein HZA19_00740, partial [Nitrospirae bacterium]|nr:hypothetical protein [Nitrospirota bacterium]
MAGRLRFFILLSIFFLPHPALGAVEWSLSVVEGFYYPTLDTLNDALTSPLVEVGPRKPDARPVSYPVIYQGPSPAMPEMEPKAPKFGLQVQADLNPRYALIFGGSIGVMESQVRDIRTFFVGFYIDSPRETRFSLALNQLYFGVRRYVEIGQRKKGGGPKPRIYGDLGLIGITGATLSTDVWLHVFAPEEGFDFYKVT